MVYTRQGYKKHGLSPVQGSSLEERKGRQKKITNFFSPKNDGITYTNETLDWSIENKCTNIVPNKEDPGPNLAMELAAAEKALDTSRVEKIGRKEVDDFILKQIDELIQGGTQTEKGPTPKITKASDKSDINTLFHWVKDILDEMKLIKSFLYESHDLLTTLTNLIAMNNLPRNNNKQTDQGIATLLLQDDPPKGRENSKVKAKNRAQVGSPHGCTKKTKNIKHTSKTRKSSDKMNYHNLFKLIERKPKKERKSTRSKRNSDKSATDAALTNTDQTVPTQDIEDKIDMMGKDPWTDVINSNSEKNYQVTSQTMQLENRTRWKLRLMTNTLAFCGYPKRKGTLTQNERKWNLISILEPIIPELTSTSQILNVDYLFYNYTQARAIASFKDSILTNRIYGRRKELAKRGITVVRYFKNNAQPLPLLSGYTREMERENPVYVQEKHIEEDLIQISEDHPTDWQNDYKKFIENYKDDSYVAEKINPDPAWPAEEAEIHLISSFSKLPIDVRMSLVNRLDCLVATLRDLKQPPNPNDVLVNHQLPAPGCLVETQVKDRAKIPLEPTVIINKRVPSSNLIVPADHPNFCLITEAPLHNAQSNPPDIIEIN